MLANIVGHQGNDEVYTGPHDLNLLYDNKDNFVFSHREEIGLLEGGLSQFNSENTPIWYWCSALKGFDRGVLFVHSLNGGTNKRIGALRAMTLIRKGLPSDLPIRRTAYIEYWLSEDSPDDLKVSVLDYLAETGDVSDLDAIKTEMQRGSYRTQTAASRAMIKIQLQNSRDKALELLNEIQPQTIEVELLSELFENYSAISTGTLIQATKHQNLDVRELAAKALSERGALSAVLAEHLITDKNPKVCYSALQTLAAGGRTFSEDEAKKILLKPRQTLLGGLPINENSVGAECLEKFLLDQLEKLPIHELEIKVADTFVFDREADFVLVRRQFSKYERELRSNVDDNFSVYFEKQIKRMEDQVNPPPEMIERLRGLSESIRQKYTRLGVNILTTKRDPQDLPRIRKILRDGFIEISAPDIQFLHNSGEWDDISLIISSIEKYSNRPRGLLTADDGDFYRAAAKTIHALSQSRLHEILDTPMPNRLLVYVVATSTDQAFRSLDDTNLQKLLASEHHDVRKVTATKSVAALTKVRLRKLLAEYTGLSPHYYNVTHWLDLGISAPREIAVSAVRRVLARWGAR